ncbi:MAG: zinc ribbon domain-containing protein [Clostridia bacterium]|nr:zinc ribbon domain-containing protein [Clostridia bacterium]
MSEKVWTYWKCPSCGKIIRGDNRDCPNCGRPISADAKYLMPDNPEVVSAIADGSVLIKGETRVDEKGIVAEIVPDELASDKPNWKCVFCGFQNRFENTTCQSCGAGKEQAKFDYFDSRPVMDEDNQKDYERRTGLAYEPVSEPEPVTECNYVSEPESLLKRILNVLRDNVQIVAGVLAILFLIWLFTPITRTASVKGFEWERSITVEEYTLCHESDWSVPSGGKVASQREEIHHYDSVFDHYETRTRQVAETVLDGYDTSYIDLGNGQAEVVETPRYRTEYHEETYEEPVYRQEPVYRTKYYYDIGRWKSKSSIDTSGANQNPYWGKCDYPSSVSSPNYGDKRQGDRDESYYAVVTDEKGDNQSVKFGYSDWSELKTGDKISYKTFRFSQKPL